jgi:hypothetical protein
MLDNRSRRRPEAHLRWARMRTSISMVFMNPIAIVFPGFILAGIAMVTVREMVPHPWLGACYEIHLEARGRGQTPVCVKHIPFAGG